MFKIILHFEQKNSVLDIYTKINNFDGYLPNETRLDYNPKNREI